MNPSVFEVLSGLMERYGGKIKCVFRAPTISVSCVSPHNRRRYLNERQLLYEPLGFTKIQMVAKDIQENVGTYKTSSLFLKKTLLQTIVAC